MTLKQLKTQTLILNVEILSLPYDLCDILVRLQLPIGCAHVS